MISRRGPQDTYSELKDNKRSRGLLCLLPQMTGRPKGLSRREDKVSHGSLVFLALSLPLFVFFVSFITSVLCPLGGSPRTSPPPKGSTHNAGLLDHADLLQYLLLAGPPAD